MAYDVDFEAKRIVDALELQGATMTLTCALREAHTAGRSERESPRELAMWSVDLATADLILAVTQCQSTDEALSLSQFIQPLILKLEAAESAARAKADQLSGASR